MSKSEYRLEMMFDRILIKPKETEKVSEGGIIIPDTAKEEKVEEGTVIAIGPGYLDDIGNFHDTKLKPGDQILFGRYAGSELEIDKQKLLVMKERDVLGVFIKKTE